MKKLAAVLTGICVMSSQCLAAELYYNGKNIDNTVYMVNNRTMVQYEELFGLIGADYRFDSGKGTVTASRNDTAITFSVNSGTIFVDKNGEKSTITMDAAPEFGESRELEVPVRYICDAFGIEVAWDADMQTVVIIDREKYGERFEADCPNLSKLLEISAGVEKTPSEAYFNLEFSGAETSDESDGNVKLFVQGESYQYDGQGTAALSGTFNMSGGDMDSIDLKDLKADVVVNGFDVYIRTNLGEKIPGLDIDSGDWYKLSVYELMESIYGKKMTDMMFLADKGEIKLIDVIMPDGFENSENPLAEAQAYDMVLRTYSSMDLLFVIKEKGADSYEISCTIDNDTYMSVLEEVSGMDMSAERDMFDMDITVTQEIKDNAMSYSDVHISVVMNDTNSGFNMEMFIDVNEKAAKQREVTVPEESKDISELVGIIYYIGAEDEPEKIPEYIPQR